MTKPEGFLGSSEPENIDQFWDKNKKLISKLGEPSIAEESLQEQIAQLEAKGFVKGARVRGSKVVGSNRKGVVVGLNTVRGGFYPADRYPILVKWDDENQTFEYGEESIELDN